MSYSSEPDRHIKVKVKVVLELPNYALKHATVFTKVCLITFVQDC